MKQTLSSPGIDTADHPLSKYYQFQSRIYDATRWSFLFGRRKLIQLLPFDREQSLSILEVGCGTGYNLTQLAEKYPNAQVTGVDLSADMLAIASEKVAKYDGRVQTINGAFGQLDLADNYDLIVFSYCLTMVNPGCLELIELAKDHLAVGGSIAVVDFHHSRHAFFRRHMSGHHVRMEEHLLPVLQAGFEPTQQAVRSAYGGVWEWFYFIGRKQG